MKRMDITALKKLLVDEEYVNLHFVWEDGTKISAHQNIVFKNAPYFK